MRKRLQSDITYRCINVQNEEKKRIINKDKFIGILMLIMTGADIAYMYIWSISVILDILILMWVLVMLPNVFVYIRGDGKWLKI